MPQSRISFTAAYVRRLELWMLANPNPSADPVAVARLSVSKATLAAAVIGIYSGALAMAMFSGGGRLPGGVVFLIVSAVLGATLVALSLIDIDQLRLPNTITFPLIAAGLLHTYVLDAPSIVLHTGAAAAGYISLAIIDWLYRHSRGISGIGLGDAKLFAAAGAWLGPAAMPTVLMLAATSGLAMAFALYISGVTMSARTRLPFGPCLALAFWIVWLWGPLETWL